MKCNFSNVHNFAKRGWIFTGIVKKRIQAINFKSLHYTKKKLDVQKENVPRYLMSAKKTLILQDIHWKPGSPIQTVN